MTLRNRELLNLIAVGLLTAIGFASVYIARSSLVDAGSLTYAGIFVALYLLAHLVARFTVPFADPVLLPLSALLAAIGVTMIYRLNPDDALRQGLWIVIGGRPVRTDARGAPARLPSCSSPTSTCSESRRSCC